MAPRSVLVGIVRRGLWLAGVCLLLVIALAYLDRFFSIRAERARFLGGEEKSRATVGTTTDNARAVESSRYSVAFLRIPGLHLEVPVLAGTDEVTLNRGVGWIEGTSLPGERGNMGIAGHRDSFFRPLEEIRVGDEIEVLTVQAKHIYTVDGTRVVSPSEWDVLRPRAASSITLVTCYPFRFIGPAPERYIVEASLKQ